MSASYLRQRRKSIATDLTPESYSIKLWGNIPGEIQVDMVIGPKGTVVQLNDFTSTYAGKAADLASAELRNWKFTPGYYRGYYVSMHFKVEIKISRDSISVHIPDYAKSRGCKYSPSPSM